MASGNDDTNDSDEEIVCPLGAFGCVHSFRRSQISEHYTSELHYKSVIGSICANRLTYEDALLDHVLNPSLIGDVPCEAQLIVTEYQQLMKTLTLRMADIYGASSTASTLIHDRALPNRTLIDHSLRGLVQRTDEHSHHNLTLQSLQTQGQLNDTKIEELCSLMTEPDGPTSVPQLIESAKQKQDPPVVKEPNNTQLYMDSCRMLQIQLDETPVSTDGLLIWQVGNISKKIDDAVCNKSRYIDSPLFQTYINGHRLWARFYPNGNADRCSLSFKVHLNFPVSSPFRGRITFILVDRSASPNLKHIIRSCEATGDNVDDQFGFDTFADKNLLHGDPSDYIRDDSIYLLVRIDQTEAEKFANLDPNIQDALLQSDGA